MRVIRFFRYGSLIFFVIFFCNTNKLYSKEKNRGGGLDYLNYPKYLFVEYGFGFSSEIKLVSRNDQKGLELGPFNYNYIGSENLFFQFLGFSISWCQINKVWTKNINAYPSIGFGTNLFRLSNKGLIFNIFSYFSLEKDYWSKFHIYPSISLGFSYLNISVVKPKPILIPDGVNKNGTLKTKKTSEPDSEWHSVKYRSGLGVFINHSIETLIRISDNFLLKFIVGISYIPSFSKLSTSEIKEKNKNPESNSFQNNNDKIYLKRKSLLYADKTDLYLPSFGIRLGYSVNPDPDITLYLGSPNKNKISVTFLFSLDEYDRNLEFDVNKYINNTNKNYSSKNKLTRYSINKLSNADNNRYSYYSKFGLSSIFYKSLGDYNSFIFGTSIIFDNGILELSKKMLTSFFISPLKVSLESGHAFTYGKLFLEQIVGFNILTPEFSISKGSELFYNIFYFKLNTSYILFKNFSVGLGLTFKIKDITKEVKTKKEYQLKIFYPEIRISYIF